MSESRPFLINSNLPLSDSDVADYETLMRSVAGNVGNSYISYALIKEVCGAYRSVPQIQSIYTYDFANAARDAEFINSECSHVFLVLQDQIRLQESYGLKLPYDQIIRFLKQIHKPIVIAGLGANSFTGFDAHFHEKLPSDLVAFLRDLSGLVKNMGVRGDFTHEVLNRLGITNVTTIGCPSYYENGASRQIVKRGIRNLASSTNVSEDLMLRSVVYLQDHCAHEERMIRNLAFGESIPLSCLEKTLYSENRLRFFSSIPEWKADLATRDFFIGTRVHGSIVALNSGVPAIVMNSDSRAREMCEYLNIPYHPELGGESDPQVIYESCDYEKMNREYGQKWSVYRDFLAQFGVPLLPPSLGGGMPSKKIVWDAETSRRLLAQKLPLSSRAKRQFYLFCSMLLPWRKKFYRKRLLRVR